MKWKLTLYQKENFWWFWWQFDENIYMYDMHHMWYIYIYHIISFERIILKFCFPLTFLKGKNKETTLFQDQYITQWHSEPTNEMED